MRHTLLCAAICAAIATPAFAQSTNTPTAGARKPGEDRLLDTIVVTATRTERAIEDVPNTVGAIDREEMDRHLVHDLKDLFRYDPGITVGRSAGRFGIGDIRIRGLGGNRVRIQTDGIPVSDAFAIGSFSNANRNFVDVDTLKRVEVVRGPTSSLYGSDALGGVVAFITKDPSDYLTADKHAYTSVKLGYDGEWNGLFAGATAAFGGDRWSGMLAAGYRQGRETRNQGTNDVVGALRTTPDPQDRSGGSVLAKLVYAPSRDQRFRLTVEGNEDSARTQMLSQAGFQALTGATNTRVEADDHQTRARVSFAHEMDGLDAGIADSADWQVYRQDSETTQDTLEERRLPPPTLQDRRERRFNFDQRTYGLQANLRKSFGSRVRHDLAYGIDVSRTDTRQKRDGLRTFTLTGATTPNMPPDAFPVRDFPISRTTNAALYVQDEIAFADDAFRLVPAVRVDHYRLAPRVDAIFAQDNPGVAVARISETAVSPKLGAVWRLADRWSLYGGYSRGFRAPPYNDVNIGFTNVQFGYTAIANPDLRPETSNGLEAGLRFAGAAVHASVSTYYNRYDDFIASSEFVGFNAQGLMVFQSRNVSEATIRGAEAKAAVDLGALSASWQGWSLRGAAAWARGQDDTDDVPLDGIDPLNASLGIAFERDGWGAELAGRAVERKRRVSDPALFRQGGYGVVDLYAHWAFAPGARIDVGIANLGDRTYIDLGGVPLANATSRVLDRYTAAGRTLSASVSVAW